MIHRRHPSPSCRDLDASMAQVESSLALRRMLMSENSPVQGPALALLDAVALFEELRIGYALIGGMASMYYGRSRFTEDVDFVAATGHRAIRDQNPQVLEAHGFDARQAQVLYHQSGAQVDLWKDEHADGIVARAVTADSPAGRCASPAHST